MAPGTAPIRAYAFCILTGILVAVWLGRAAAIPTMSSTSRSGRCRSIWAVPFDLPGGRLCHLATDPELYFKAGQDPWRAFALWDGGLGIPGAVLLGALGAWIGCRRKGIRLAEDRSGDVQV